MSLTKLLRRPDKKETGKTASEHIQLAVMAKVKEQLTETDKTISEIAYDLGFNYPHHLSRSFKKITGVTPENSGIRQYNGSFY